MSLIVRLFRGDSLTVKTLRSSTWAILGHGGGQGLRLLSNLILTRLLFPEAFGLMALVHVLVIGLMMFSDVGIGPAIMRSARGDDEDFLNTAWTIQIIRGICLFLVACGLAWPVSVFYAEPALASMVPVVALTLVLTGFTPTRVLSAPRHLAIGRVTMIELASQTVGIAAAITLAWLLQSVWALVFSALAASVVQLLLNNLFLPGPKNHIRWEKSSISELVHFGKWIFLSTVAGFLFLQGDKVVLGKYIPIEMLGIYNIGFFLASFPLALGSAVVQKVMIPVYRERPPDASAANFLKLRKMRFALTGALMCLLLPLAFFGGALIDFLYDPRYAAAGTVLILIACLEIPVVIVLTYDQAALAAGNSKRFFILTAAKAAILMTALIIGAEQAGLFGVLMGQAIAMILIYPVAVWLARRQAVWDPLHDLVFGAVGLVLATAAIWLNFEEIIALSGI